MTPSISSLVRCSFVWALRVVYFPLKHSCLHVQYRSKVLVHFPQYCCSGIAVCISGLTSEKPRLTSLKTPVLPRFFAVKNTAVKNRMWRCLNSLLFPLFQRLINFNKRDVARRWFYDVIHFTFDFCFYRDSQTLTSEHFWELVSFATARRNKTDIIEIELLRLIHTPWRSVEKVRFHLLCKFHALLNWN